MGTTTWIGHVTHLTDLFSANPSNRKAVRHATSLFLSRTSDRANKCSAGLAPHRVLEDRRLLIN